MPKTHIVDAATGQTTTRDLTPAEQAEYDARQTSAAAEATAEMQRQADRTTARNAVLTLIQGAVGKRFQDTTQAEKLAMVAALLFQAGALDKDLIVRPPADWLR